MTMKVTFTNTDASRKLRVTKRDIPLNTDGTPKGPPVPESKPTEFAPGESGEVWIYQGRDALLEEV